MLCVPENSSVDPEYISIVTSKDSGEVLRGISAASCRVLWLAGKAATWSYTVSLGGRTTISRTLSTVRLKALRCSAGGKIGSTANAPRRPGPEASRLEGATGPADRTRAG